MDEKKAFHDYIERMTQIRKLSSPSIDEIESPEEYSALLRANFERIGMLARQNRDMLDHTLYPLLSSAEDLGEEQIRAIHAFGDELLDASGLENLDLPIMSLLSDKLYTDAMRKKDDLYRIIRELDTELSTCYTLMNMTQRIVSAPEIADSYRKKGFEAGKFFLHFLEKSRFLEISDPGYRAMIVTNARYSAVFYEGMPYSRETNAANLALLERMYKIPQDPFYRDALPGYDWDYYQFRLLQYYAFLTDYRNLRQFDASELSLILARTLELWELYDSHKDTFSAISEGREIELLVLRNRYLAGDLEETAYQNALMELYSRSNQLAYEGHLIYENLLLPAEYMLTLDPEHLSSENKLHLHNIYRNVCAYLFAMPNNGALSYLLDFTAAILRHFIEVPGALSFKDMGLNCLAALHPPTYIHSRMVGQLTECLCSHLIRLQPELLTGICGCKTAQDVADRQLFVRTFAHEAAMCHDFGKIPIIDTIFIYGRKLLDFEYDIIKQHPILGYQLLVSHTSTQDYAPIALGHHRSYNGRLGYPMDFDPSDAPCKTIIDLVQCADCMDAATDSVGRSYNTGKTYEDFLAELRADSGTRYAPWLVGLLNQPEVTADLKYLLDTGRAQIYRDTYVLLRRVRENMV